MRADRLVSILLLLQVHQRMTANELAKRLEVSRRTIYRDMEALSAAGIPITAERGTHSGWFLLEGYQTNLTGLSEAEVSTLFLPRAASLLADLGLREVADSALIKVLAALPAIQRHDAEDILQRIYVDASGWDRFDEPVPWLRLLQEAIWQERTLLLCYRRRDETVVDYLVVPLGLVAKTSIWYLVGMVKQEMRVFRAARIQEARITAHPFTRPPAFNLVAFWEQWRNQWSESFSRNLRSYEIQIRVAPALVPTLQQHYGREIDEQADAPDPDGWMRLTLAFETQGVACSHILRFGSLIEVVEPQELREQLAQIAAALLCFYQSDRT
ncbi:MAG TPA: YafY family protein [Ktedonobacteraceae bacterium]|nr:YafY family protein [Ktedonobacteraceae bacterium]